MNRKRIGKMCLGENFIVKPAEYVFFFFRRNVRLLWWIEERMFFIVHKTIVTERGMHKTSNIFLSTHFERVRERERATQKRSNFFKDKSTMRMWVCMKYWKREHSQEIPGYRNKCNICLLISFIAKKNIIYSSPPNVSLENVEDIKYKISFNVLEKL